MPPPFAIYDRMILDEAGRSHRGKRAPISRDEPVPSQNVWKWLLDSSGTGAEGGGAAATISNGPPASLEPSLPCIPSSSCYRGLAIRRQLT